MTGASTSAQLYEFTFYGTVTEESRNITAGNPLENLTPGMSTTYSFTVDPTVTPSDEDATGRLWFNPDVFVEMSFQSTALSFSRSAGQIEGGFGILDNDTSNYPGMFEDAMVLNMLMFGSPIELLTFQLQSITSTADDFIDGLDIPASINPAEATIAQYGVSSGSAFRLIQINTILIREIPAPSAATLLAAGGLVALRRRR